MSDPPVKGEIIVSNGFRKVTTIPISGDGQLLVTDSQSANGLAYVEISTLLNLNKKIFSAYDSAGSINISGGPTAITWATESQKDNDCYTHAANSSSVMVTKSGNYRVIANITAATAVSLTQTTCYSRLEVNTGGGFVTVPGATSWGNLGTITGGAATMTIDYIGTVAAGSVFRIVSERISGVGLTATIINSSRLTIESV
jgi:hypothetical protein